MKVDMEEIRALIADAIDVDECDIRPDAHFVDEIGVDSLSSLEVLVRLERHYGIKIPEADLLHLVSLNDVINYLSKFPISEMENRMESKISNTDIVKEILCDVLEIEPDDLTEEGNFVDEYDADSLRAVEILASLERRFKIRIPEAELANMENFKNVKEVLSRYGWTV